MYIDWIRLEDNGYTEVFTSDDTKESGSFGVYTETTPVNSGITFAPDDTDPGFPYMYHCHLTVHEDQGLLGQFVVVEPGTPDSAVSSPAS